MYQNNKRILFNSRNENFIILNLENKQKEIGNIPYSNDSSFILGKYLQIELFDYSGRKLNLSVCNEDINIMMNLKDNEELDIQLAEKFAKQNIDIFNAADNFFNDLCYKYDGIDNTDITINDRRKDIYKNVTFCQPGCNYKNIDYDLMAANCICNSEYLEMDEISFITNKTIKINFPSFKKLSKIFTSDLIFINMKVI